MECNAWLGGENEKKMLDPRYYAPRRYEPYSSLPTPIPPPMPYYYKPTIPDIDDRMEKIRREKERLKKEKALREAEDILREEYEEFIDGDKSLEESLDAMLKRGLCNHLSVWGGL